MDIIADDTQKLSTLNREEETLSDYYQETIDDATRKNKVLTTNKRHGQDSHSRISTREIKEYMDGLQEEAKYNQDKREKKMTESQGQYETCKDGLDLIIISISRWFVAGSIQSKV